MIGTMGDFSARRSCGSVRKKINEGDDAGAMSNRPILADAFATSGRNHLKRARFQWSFDDNNVYLGQCLEDSRHWGLNDMFAGHSTPRSAVATASSSTNKLPFSLFRLEHREGGDLVQHLGEERILLFREDCAGAIGKIILSSVAAAPDRTVADPNQRYCVAQARIHVLNVKEPYRGYDLGGLLFTQAMVALKHRYRNELGPMNDRGGFIQCQLDVEEDSRRHNKLVRFYKSLGCDIKSQGKVQYINHNDDETYRKVPMHISINMSSNTQQDPPVKQSLLERSCGFTPVVLRGPRGQPISLTDSYVETEWILVDLNNGKVELHTTKGQRTRAQAGGTMNGEECKGYVPDDPWSQFRLIRTSLVDMLPGRWHSHVTQSKRIVGSKLFESQELWLLQSEHGTYLSIDECRLCLQCCERFSFWTVDEGSLTLRWTADTPLHRAYYLQKWQSQTVGYAQRMREKYFGFNLCSLSLYEALQKARLMCEPCLGYGGGGHLPSLRSLCFRRADTFRRQGHPDWMQLVALIYSLGTLIKSLDTDFLLALEEEWNVDWTVPSQSWIVGCPPPASVACAEMCWTNPDLNDSRYGSLHGMYDASCGLDRVLLTWSTQEYMHGLLRHNNADLPDEAAFMLRFASLSVWHTEREYRHLVNERDQEILPFVSDFEVALREGTREAMERPELSERDCEHLWLDHFESIAEKYGVDGELEW